MGAGSVKCTMFSADPSGIVRTAQYHVTDNDSLAVARNPNGTHCVSEMWSPSLETDSGAIAAPQPSADRLE